MLNLIYISISIIKLYIVVFECFWPLLQLLIEGLKKRIKIIKLIGFFFCFFKDVVKMYVKYTLHLFERYIFALMKYNTFTG